MDAIRATAATTATSSTGTSAASTTKTPDAEKSFATLFAEAKDDLRKGEKLTKVDGHEFARIKGGTRDDMCVNLSGNERSGETFDLIWRGGRQFHVYGGNGADHKVVEVGRKAAGTTAADTGSTATDASGGTTPATSS
ncbi:MAG TPA: hypothetical protein VNT03_08235 [Baekduia sp.]|nr:hypothetical protein [Baekduia sp.]